ncbi:MAG: hypothetical protein C7B45_09870 [Sulfobacillus acidophilus]|uniref:Alpha-galactosidase n=1 Tax=Sulfobacillus acidophilus TaxID=53633 RepID=A0A2T2WHH7_9FIRM|nr:MAG: hypothetical protein C7B45_09870 [Sulfobacillus acidophilus]
MKLDSQDERDGAEPKRGRHGMTRRQVLKWGAGSGAAIFASSLPFSSALAKSLRSRSIGGQTIQAFINSPPFSFLYGNQSSDTLLTKWPKEVLTSQTREGVQTTTIRWTDPVTHLEVQWVASQYAGFPTSDWIIYFANRGKTRTAVLSQILALDWNVSGLSRNGWIIHSNNGSHDQPTDFAPYEIPLVPNSFRVFSTSGGRSSNGYHNSDLSGTNILGGWPYLNVDWSSGGMIVALGWPGQWVMQVERLRADTLRLYGGMSQVDGTLLTNGQDIFSTDLAELWLAPGETIRTPRIVVMPWEKVPGNTAGWIDAQNQWRQWFIQYHLPRKQGKLPDPLCPAVANGFFSEQGGPDGTDDQANELSWLNAYGAEHDTPSTGGVHNYWWIDAGWYETPPGPITWVSVGTWTPSPTRFPHGLSPIFQRAKDLGMGSILWFEPERVMPGTWLYDRRSSWLLKPPPGLSEYSGQARLLDFGKEEVVNWAVEHFGALITTQKVDVYREDYNIDPLPYWQFNDPPGRRGITQIQYVTGHLEYWGALLAKHPGLLIDCCASGGRRLDIDSMGYAINLWRSDYSNVAESNQGMTFGVSAWLPMTGDQVLIQSFSGKGTNEYNARSAMAPSFQEIVQVPSAVTENWNVLRAMSFEWIDIAPNYFGDYYPLTAFAPPEDTSVWMAWQFNQSTTGTGFVQAFRRGTCPQSTMRLTLHGLSLHANYRLYDYATQSSWIASGSQLQQGGLVVNLPTTGSATTIRYVRL